MLHLLSGLAANPALPPHLVDRLIDRLAWPPTGEADEDLCLLLASALADRPDLSRAQTAALAGLDDSAAVALAYNGHLRAADTDPAAQPDAAIALLDEGRGDPSWAARLAADPDPARRERLAGCPGLPPDVAETLAGDPETDVVEELARHAPPELAARLAAHPHARVRLGAAANEATPPAVLAALLTGEGLPPARWCDVCERRDVPFPHPLDCPLGDCELPPGAGCLGGHESALHAIRYAALGNPSTPADAAARLVGHPSMMLRQALAGRTDLPPEEYAWLAGDTTAWVRTALAGNPAVGEAVLRRLAVDPDAAVLRALAHHPRLPLDLLARTAASVRVGPELLPRIAGASPAETRELAGSADARVRMLVARRRDLPSEVRDTLAADPDAKVAASVAGHPGLGGTALRSMARRFGDHVHAAIAASPDAPPALLEALARHRPAARKALREIARHPHATAAALLPCLADARARRSAAGHPALPPDTVLSLLADPDWQVREAAAANPALPPEAMSRLCAAAAATTA
ncbi:hypothetical protein [Kitasatospora sp. NPDC085879]|uniref:hypothetical protein n=1 Tax=Kitasatospora sp. NPDC085879 TaxID=3154769 RepID=UPI003445FC66